MDVKKILLIIMLFIVVKAEAQVDTTKTDSALLKKIQEEMQQPAAAPAPQARAGASANPDISV
ncbi:MAG: hypothetical protein ACXVJD_12365, partial [Mucilaginibacter sp.]